MSPSLLPRADAMEVSSATGARMMVQISKMPASARMSACRNRTGPPSSDTTRRPSASLPTVLPRVRVSRIVG